MPMPHASARQAGTPSARGARAGSVRSRGGRERGYGRLRLGALMVAVAWSLVAAGAAVAPAAAARPLERIQNVINDVSCVFATAEGPTLFVFGSADSNGSGAGAFLEEGEQVLLDGQGGSIAFGDHFRASVDMRTVPAGTDAGTLTVTADLELGAASVQRVEERNGNSWTRGTLTVQDYGFANVVADLPSYTVLTDQGSCSGQRLEFDVATTNPAATVYRSADFGSDICAVDGLADTEIRLSGQLHEPYVEIVVDDGVEPRKAAGTLQRRRGAWVATLPLISLVTGEVDTLLSVSMDLRRDGRVSHGRTSEDGFTEMFWLEPYTADLTVTDAKGSAGTAHCEAANVRSHVTLAPSLSD